MTFDEKINNWTTENNIKKSFDLFDCDMPCIYMVFEQKKVMGTASTFVLMIVAYVLNSTKSHFQRESKTIELYRVRGYTSTQYALRFTRKF